MSKELIMTEAEEVVQRFKPTNIQGLVLEAYIQQTFKEKHCGGCSGECSSCYTRMGMLHATHTIKEVSANDLPEEVKNKILDILN